MVAKHSRHVLGQPFKCNSVSGHTNLGPSPSRRKEEGGRRRLAKKQNLNQGVRRKLGLDAKLCVFE